MRFKTKMAALALQSSSFGGSQPTEKPKKWGWVDDKDPTAQAGAAEDTIATEDVAKSVITPEQRAVQAFRNLAQLLTTESVDLGSIEAHVFVPKGAEEVAVEKFQEVFSTPPHPGVRIRNSDFRVTGSCVEIQVLVPAV